MPELDIPFAFKKVMGKKRPELQAAILRCLTRLQENPAHPGLQVHPMQGRPNVWEAYVDRANRVTFERHGDVIRLRMNCNHDMLRRNP